MATPVTGHQRPSTRLRTPWYRRIFSQFWQFIKKHTSIALLNIFFIVNIIILVLLVIVVVSDVWAQTQILKNVGSPTISFNPITTWVLSFCVNCSDGKFPISQAEPALKIILDSAIFLITVFVVIYPVIAQLRSSIKAEKEKTIELEDVYQKGEDDLKIMLEYYSDAESVVVFSGSFSWLKYDSRLKNVVIDLANSGNIRFVTNKSENLVRENIGDDLFNKLKEFNNIKQIDHRELKCSFIQSSGMKTILYLTQNVNRSLQMCIVSGKNIESIYLLNAIETLIEKTWA